MTDFVRRAIVMRYYEREHFDGYAQIKREGLAQWSDLHESLDGFGDFPHRLFLERVMPVVGPNERIRVLEYGCGTGPAACYLAERGYEMHGIDLVPDAIDLARRHAAERDLNIHFEVANICHWNEPAHYDFILDSFCLQSIVLDPDRAQVLDGVRRQLESSGRYVLSTSMYDSRRSYGNDHFDPQTGIVWVLTNAPHADARRIGPSWYLPHRRHLTPAALRNELEGHGFRILEQSQAGGDVVCE